MQHDSSSQIINHSLMFESHMVLSGNINSDKKTGKVKVVHFAYEEAVYRQTESPNRA